MLTTDIIITGIFLLLSGICFFASVWNCEGVSAGAMLAIAVISGVAHFELIDAEKRGNREFVTYSFPSETYKMEMVVNDKTTTVFVNGVETEVTQKDTVYILKGIEPIFQRKGDKEKMRLKTIDREKL